MTIEEAQASKTEAKLAEQGASAAAGASELSERLEKEHAAYRETLGRRAELQVDWPQQW